MSGYTERALKRISPIYDNSKFIREFFKGVGVDFDLIREYFTTLREQRFIDVVEWGMDYQELKYSLDIRRDMSLEERRKRLGIKARKHLPLNPAILEKYLKEYFDFDSYVYEKDAGHIWVYTQRIGEGYDGAIEWLLAEKPAHLLLGLALHMVEYIGSGTFECGIYPPHMPIPLPKTMADKSKYPRLFAGVAQKISGEKVIGPSQLKHSEAAVKAGTVQVVTGEGYIAPSQLRHSAIVRHAGVAIYIGGEVTIGHEDVAPIARIMENPYSDLAIANSVLPRGQHYYFIPPTFEPDEANVIKIFWGFATSRHRRFRGVSMPNPREDLTKSEIKEVADYAVEKELLKNARGEVINRPIGAALKRYEVIEKII